MWLTGPNKSDLLHCFGIRLYPFFLFSAFLKSCTELQSIGGKTNGIFTIHPDDKEAFDVFCDQTTNGGGWIVFQTRLDGSVDFYRNWTDYRQGFGNLSGEFWLGLDKIHRLTNLANNKLRVELEDFDGNTAYAEYDTFAVADEADNFRLSVDGYSGNYKIRQSLWRNRFKWISYGVAGKSRFVWEPGLWHTIQLNHGTKHTQYKEVSEKKNSINFQPQGLVPRSPASLIMDW